MDIKKWIVVIVVLLLTSIVFSTIFLRQRNDARQQWRESREQVNQLDQRNVSLNESLQKQKDRLSAEVDLLQKKQAELDAARKQLQHASDEIVRLNKKSASLEENMAGVVRLRNRLEEEHNTLTARLEEMESDDTRKNTFIAKLNDQVAKQNQKIAELENEITTLRAAIVEKDKTLAESQESLGTLKSETDRLSQDLSVVKESAGKFKAHQKTMRETYESLVTGLKQQLESQEASIEEYREKLKVTFVDRILFGFSRVRISPEGKEALTQLAGVLANVPKGRISIIGHADNIPIAETYRYRFPSNWELSSARAAAVARHLLEQGGMEPSRIEVIGQSRYHPIADNDTEAGRAKNRRVEIIITPRGR